MRRVCSDSGADREGADVVVEHVRDGLGQLRPVLARAARRAAVLVFSEADSGGCDPR